MELAEIYEKTADVIEERGLTHGRYEDEEGRVCLFGAAHVALFGSAGNIVIEDHSECAAFGDDVMHRLGIASAVRWSDAHAANGQPEVVVAKLRELAAEIRAEVDDLVG